MKKHVVLLIPEELWMKLKHLAVDKKTSCSKMICDLIAKFLDEILP